MGTLVYGPLGAGMLTGRYRKGQPFDSQRVKYAPKHFADVRKLDLVEQLIPVAQEAGLSLTHMAMAFVMAHPGVTSAIIGPRKMEQLDDVLAGAGVVLTDEVLDRIDAIVPPGTDVGPLDSAYHPPAMVKANLRRRPSAERVAA
jgi:aryl-alcohol dehydrogenase-like predicted oxidoreductase